MASFVLPGISWLLSGAPVEKCQKSYKLGRCDMVWQKKILHLTIGGYNVSQHVTHMSHLFMTYMVIIYTKEAISLVTPCHMFHVILGLWLLNLLVRKKELASFLTWLVDLEFIQLPYLVPGASGKLHLSGMSGTRHARHARHFQTAIFGMAT